MTDVAARRPVCGRNVRVEDGRVEPHRDAANAASKADVISEELLGIGVDHAISVKFSAGHPYRSVQGIARFGSVRAFADALERAGADASYSAGAGWKFRYAEDDPDE